MTRKKRLLTSAITVLLLITIITSVFTTVLSANASVYYGNSPYISQNNGNVHVNKNDYFDGNKIYKLSDKILPTDIISWGSLMSLSQRAMLTGAWWMLLIPGIFLVVTLICITDIGEYLRTRNRRERLM